MNITQKLMKVKKKFLIMIMINILLLQNLTAEQKLMAGKFAAN